MSAIGYVTKLEDGRYQGQLKTLTIRAEVTFTPNPDKSNGNQPDYRICADGIEIGAACIRNAETSGKEYVSVSIPAPEFGPSKLYANLGKAPGQDDDNVYALIWNPRD
jgi:uncharacterized protein (DUF736 family)